MSVGIMDPVALNVSEIAPNEVWLGCCEPDGKLRDIEPRENFRTIT